MRTETTSVVDTILGLFNGLSYSNKQWLAEHLIEQVARDEAQEAAAKPSDEEFFRDLFSTPYENPTSADEAMRIIRQSRHSGITRHIEPIYE